MIKRKAAMTISFRQPSATGLLAASFEPDDFKKYTSEPMLKALRWLASFTELFQNNSFLQCVLMTGLPPGADPKANAKNLRSAESAGALDGHPAKGTLQTSPGTEVGDAIHEAFAAEPPGIEVRMSSRISLPVGVALRYKGASQRSGLTARATIRFSPKTETVGWNYWNTLPGLAIVFTKPHWWSFTRFPGYSVVGSPQPGTLDAFRVAPGETPTDEQTNGLVARFVQDYSYQPKPPDSLYDNTAPMGESKCYKKSVDQGYEPYALGTFIYFDEYKGLGVGMLKSYCEQNFGITIDTTTPFNIFPWSLSRNAPRQFSSGIIYLGSRAGWNNYRVFARLKTNGNGRLEIFDVGAISREGMVVYPRYVYDDPIKAFWSLGGDIEIMTLAQGQNYGGAITVSSSLALTKGSTGGMVAWSAIGQQPDPAPAIHSSFDNLGTQYAVTEWIQATSGPQDVEHAHVPLGGKAFATHIIPSQPYGFGIAGAGHLVRHGEKWSKLVNGERCEIRPNGSAAGSAVEVFDISPALEAEVFARGYGNGENSAYYIETSLKFICARDGFNAYMRATPAPYNGVISESVVFGLAKVGLVEVSEIREVDFPFGAEIPGAVVTFFMVASTETSKTFAVVPPNGFQVNTEAPGIAYITLYPHSKIITTLSIKGIMYRGSDDIYREYKDGTDEYGLVFEFIDPGKSSWPTF